MKGPPATVEKSPLQRHYENFASTALDKMRLTPLGFTNTRFRSVAGK
jgi:hypothetical protein